MITLTEGLEKQVSILLASCRRVMTSPSMSIGYFPCSGVRWSNFSFKRLAVLAVSPLPVSIIWHNPLFLHGIKKNPFQGSVF